MAVLFTIGYEGRDLDGFIGELQAAGVTHVADVRERPASRKEGFSKTPLSDALKDAGIGYSNWRMLGTPRPIRDRFKSDHNTERFFADYRELLAEQDEPLNELAALAADETVALLCFEANPAECHRTVTCECLQDSGEFDVRHL